MTCAIVYETKTDTITRYLDINIQIRLYTAERFFGICGRESNMSNVSLKFDWEKVCYIQYIDSQ